MKCTNPEVPEYLQWNERGLYEDKDFRYFHKLYRLNVRNNPVEIDRAWANAISCRWSKIVAKKDILANPPNPDWKDFHYVFVQELRRYRKTGVFQHETHEFTGRHVITCHMEHRPEPCDYSHIEILIRHKIFQMKSSKEELVFDKIYTYNDWKEKTALLAKDKNRFFKELKQAFRLDMIKLISRTSKSDNRWKDTLAYLYLAKRNVTINAHFVLEKKN